jgi:hypothetical protein
MPNTFKVRKYAALLLASLLPVIFFYTSLITTHNLTYAYAFLGGGVLISCVVGVKLLDYPLRGLAEGSGLGIFTFDSTGLVRTYLAKISPPYLRAKIGGSYVNTAFDRNTVNYLIPPQAAEIEQNENEIIIRLPKKDYTKTMFSFTGTYPLLFWNTTLGEFYTKDMLSKLELQTFVQHLTLYLNRKVDELSNNIRDFARHIVEQTRPKTDIFHSKLMWVIVIVVIVIVAILFLPQLVKSIGSVQLPSLPSAPITPIAK